MTDRHIPIVRSIFVGFSMLEYDFSYIDFPVLAILSRQICR